MKVIRFKEAESYDAEKDWKRTSLCDQKDISIEHFIKPPHHSTPAHDHPSAQVLMVLKGKLSIKTKDGEEKLNIGDTVYIPRNEEHFITNVLNEPSVGIDIFVSGSCFAFWLKRK